MTDQDPTQRDEAASDEEAPSSNEVTAEQVDGILEADLAEAQEVPEGTFADLAGASEPGVTNVHDTRADEAVGTPADEPAQTIDELVSETVGEMPESSDTGDITPTLSSEPMPGPDPDHAPEEDPVAGAAGHPDLVLDRDEPQRHVEPDPIVEETVDPREGAADGEDRVDEQHHDSSEPEDAAEEEVLALDEPADAGEEQPEDAEEDEDEESSDDTSGDTSADTSDDTSDDEDEQDEASEGDASEDVTPELEAAVEEALEGVEDGEQEDEEVFDDWVPGEWYVVHTYAGYENKVKTDLETRVASMNMEEKIYEVVIPMEEVMEVKGGKKQMVQRKVFPGYLLVRMEFDPDSWYVVRNTPGVTGFVGSGSKPIPLSEKEVDKILQRKGEAEKPKPRQEWQVEDPVRVTTGPFANFQGVIHEVDDERQKVKVLVNIFGRETPVELSMNEIAKV